MKIKTNPTLAMLDFLERLENTDIITEKMIRKAVAETLQTIIDAFKKRVEELANQLEETIPGISKEMANEIKEMIYTDVANFKGEKGDSIKGDKGDSIVGPPGPKGKSIIGPPGKDGKNPEPKEIVPLILKEIPEQKPEEIAKKLNTLEEKVKMKVVDGLLTTIEDIKKAIRQRETRGGGGGMGNVIHEVHDLTSATTTITLQYAIAGNGTAIFAGRYQGQVVDKDIHYSVGSGNKIITLLFTPEDGTKFSITYART